MPRRSRTTAFVRRRSAASDLYGRMRFAEAEFGRRFDARSAPSISRHSGIDDHSAIMVVNVLEWWQKMPKPFLQWEGFGISALGYRSVASTRWHEVKRRDSEELAGADQAQ